VRSTTTTRRTGRSTRKRAAATIAGILAALGTGQAVAQSQQPRPTDLGAAVETAEAMPRLHSLLVSRGGELLIERYFNGKDQADIANVKSVSKSLISALVGIAIDRGHIASLRQPIADYFGDELASQTDAPKRAITIEHLLTMQSGLETTSNRNYGAWVLSPDWVAYALRQPLENPPGTTMVYSTGNTHLLSAILTEATGRDTLTYARDVLAQPLGFYLAAWPKDPRGVYFGGNDMELTPRQMLAFGELYLNDGRANGKQIVPQRWVEASLVPRAESRRERDRYYGYGWWIRDAAGVTTPYAWGFGGQFIILVPELDVAIVATSASTPDNGRRGHRQILHRMIESQIIAPLAAARSDAS
jgi:CubicO group peptidase (beta-lactamase class C family)